MLVLFRLRLAQCLSQWKGLECCVQCAVKWFILQRVSIICKWLDFYCVLHAEVYLSMCELIYRYMQTVQNTTNIYHRLFLYSKLHIQRFTMVSSDYVCYPVSYSRTLQETICLSFQKHLHHDYKKCFFLFFFCRISLSPRWPRSLCLTFIIIKFELLGKLQRVNLRSFCILMISTWVRQNFFFFSKTCWNGAARMSSCVARNLVSKKNAHQSANRIWQKFK